MAMDFNVSPQSIIDLMLRQGEIEGQRKREEIAQNELERQRKHAWAKYTLKGLATVAPFFIPGGPLAGLLGKKWSMLGMSPLDKLLIDILTKKDPGMSDPGYKPSIPSGQFPTRFGNTGGIGFNTFAGPMTRDDWHVPSWDEEGIG